MIKAIVTGCAGRMGRSIINIIEGSAGIELAGGTDQPSGPFIGQDIGEIAGVGKKNIPISSSLDDVIEDADVIIDFSIPAASLEHFLKSVERGKSIVIGTTGFDEEHWKTFDAMSKSAKAVIAPNMSVGVNALFKLAKEAAVALGDGYDVEIVEMHHNQKADAPSGTGVRLSEIVAEALGRDISRVGVYGRHGQVGKRSPEEIGVMTLRGGDVVGDHTVIFAGPGERVELTHRAGSRDNFAMGAVRAAKWVVGRPPGVYDMQDVLGLK